MIKNEFAISPLKQRGDRFIDFRIKEPVPSVYNIETILAEKVETILRRGELNTRPRDFYDVYILAKTKDFERSIFLKALKSTAEHRKTSHIFKNINHRMIPLQKGHYNPKV